MKNKIFFIPILLCFLGITSCQKEFLEKKPDKALLIPKTFEDFQALLDNTEIMNTIPGLPLISADDFYVTDNTWLSWSLPAERNSYLWSKDVYEGQLSGDWLSPYQAVFYSNIVLEGLGKMKLEEQSSMLWQQQKGAALFYRAMAFYYLAESFAKPYEVSSASTDLGIILPLDPDVNLRPGRSTVKQTYDRIIADLELAKDMVPLSVQVKTRPSKVTVLAFLSKVYLAMKMYDKSESFSEQTLALYNKLIDYNTLNASASNSFPETLPNGNDEVILFTNPVLYSFDGARTTLIDTNLYSSFSDYDKRKTVFFRNRGKGVINYKGYRGLSVPEVYLIHAESCARNNKISASIEDINKLVSKRWDSNNGYIPYTATTSEEALKICIEERKKELACKGNRWLDLRRLNSDSHFSITLTRKLNGLMYALKPGDSRYVFPIPDDEIRLTGIVQNPR